MLPGPLHAGVRWGKRMRALPIMPILACTALLFIVACSDAIAPPVTPPSELHEWSVPGCYKVEIPAWSKSGQAQLRNTRYPPEVIILAIESPPKKACTLRSNEAHPVYPASSSGTNQWMYECGHWEIVNKNELRISWGSGFESLTLSMQCRDGIYSGGAVFGSDVHPAGKPTAASLIPTECK